MLYQLSYFRKKQTASRQLINVLIRRLQPRPVRQKVGRDGFEPPKAYASRFTVCPIWPLWYLPNIFLYGCVISLQKFGADGGIRTHDPEITNHVLWPTELHRHSTVTGCKGRDIFYICKFSEHFFSNISIFLLSSPTFARSKNGDHPIRYI